MAKLNICGGGGGVDQIFRPWRICLAVDRGNFRDRATLVK